MQYYDITVPSNGAQFAIAAPGRFLYYLGGSAGGADSTLRVKAGNSGAAFLLKPGQSIRLPSDVPAVDTWYLTNYGMAAPILGQVLIGDGDFTDNRISGSVEVVDGGKNRVMANAEFMFGSGLNGDAGDMPHLQLWNPAGSEVNVIVQSMTISTGDANEGFQLYTANAALTDKAGNGLSKLVGGADSVAEYRQGIYPAIQGANKIHGWDLSQSQPFYVTLKTPFVLSPGTGLNVVNRINGSNINAVFEWYEEKVNT